MRRQKGFTLIELLIVVAIIGIIAAIAIPNLLNAINRARQKRSMSDMRTIGTAIEAYAVDWSFYPTVAEGVVDPTLSVIISPVYVKKTPAADGWRYPFNAVSESRFYTIGSAARDRTWETHPRQHQLLPSADHRHGLRYHLLQRYLHVLSGRRADRLIAISRRIGTGALRRSRFSFWAGGVDSR